MTGLLVAVSGELGACRTALATVQDTVADLLAGASLSKEAAKGIQDLDRISQIVENLERIGALLAASEPQGQVCTAALSASISLGDLRDRLLGAAQGATESVRPGGDMSAREGPGPHASAADPGRAEDDPDGVTWL